MVTYESPDEINPWAADTWSVTAQGRFLKRMIDRYGPKSGMARAEQFAKEAGSRLGATKPPREKPFQVIVQRRYLQPPTKDTTLGFGMNGLIAAQTQWTLPVVTERVQWPSTVTPSDARCDVAPTNDAILTLSTATNVQICTVTFPAGSTVGTFTWTAPASLICQPGDLLYLFANGPQDDTFAGVNIAFIGRQLS